MFSFSDFSTGQQRLRNAKVLIVGAGGLGCPAAAYLAGAGVGTIGIIDGDVVEISNLHRQILHTIPKVGMYKVDSAIEYLKRYRYSHITSLILRIPFLIRIWHIKLNA